MASGVLVSVSAAIPPGVGCGGVAPPALDGKTRVWLPEVPVHYPRDSRRRRTLRPIDAYFYSIP